MILARFIGGVVGAAIGNTAKGFEFGIGLILAVKLALHWHWVVIR